MRPTLLLATALVVLSAVLAGCSGDEPPRHEVAVFAAASLTEALGELAERFEADHPGTTVTLNLGSSTALAEQIRQGAPADVFASADEANMAKLEDADLVGDPAAFATNSMAIVVEPGNPAAIRELADLGSPDLAVVLCAPTVPCGRYAQEVLDGAGVAVTPRSFEQDVKGVVTKVALGEADAGLAYLTDALAAGRDTDRIAIPDDENAIATYPIAVVREAAGGAVARAFVEFVRSEDARAILTSHGFGAP